GAVIHIQDPGLSPNSSDVKKIENTAINEIKNVSNVRSASFNLHSNQGKESPVSDTLKVNSSLRTISTNNDRNCDISICDSIKDGKWQYAAYLDAIKELTEDLQLSAEGVAE
ncbi:unnamed protein product, partial [Meganyctiphanes norvegica]